MRKGDKQVILYTSDLVEDNFKTVITILFYRGLLYTCNIQFINEILAKKCVSKKSVSPINKKKKTI
jgi:hypothetical protein